MFYVIETRTNDASYFDVVTEFEELSHCEYFVGGFATESEAVAKAQELREKYS